jgi:ABC-2 type transport system ATP-binding protein
VRTYSLGMRQRLGLAAALLGRPSLLVLDEPVNGLDPAGVHWLRTALTDFAADGGTVLLSSHILAEVAKTVDRILIVHSGRLLADAHIDEFQDGAALEATYLKLTAEVTS